MISAVGRTFIKNYLAGHSGTMVGAISVGVGATPATLNDASMQFEFSRTPISIIQYDTANDVLVFKATLDETVAGKIYEVALWTAETNPAAGSQQSRLITSFDSDTENWGVGATFESTVARIGVDSMKHTPAASASISNVLTNLILDFASNSSQATFLVAYNCDNANTANIKVRFRVDNANYYEYTITSPAAGYNFASLQKGAAAVVGTPSWDNINEIEIITTAKSGGSASVEFDGIRIEDIDIIGPEYGLVARYVLDAPITKEDGKVQDIEYTLDVNV